MVLNIYKQNNSVNFLYKFYYKPRQTPTNPDKGKVCLCFVYALLEVCYTFKKHFYTQRIATEKRIGPHDKEVLSALVGHLLGDAHGEKRCNKSRFTVHIQSRNAEYIFWSHKFFVEKGYCSPKKPVVKKQIGKNNKIYYSIRFITFSFSSLNYLYDYFYKVDIDSETKSRYKKTIPTNIKKLLTLKSLAIWIMDGGSESGSGLKISTESFSLQENILLQQALYEKYSIKPSIQHHKDKYLLYFIKSDKILLYTLIKPHLLPCMHYKFDIKK